MDGYYDDWDDGKKCYVKMAVPRPKMEKSCQTYHACFKLYKVCYTRLYKCCPHCGHEFDYHKHRGCCPHCGCTHDYMVMMVCRRCGAEYPREAGRCPHCGYY